MREEAQYNMVGTFAVGIPESSTEEKLQKVATIVDQQVSAYNRGDIDGFIAAYAPNARIYKPLAQETPILTGHSEIRAAYGALFSTPGGMHVDIEGRLACNSTLTDLEHLTLLERRAVVTYEIVDGYISRAWIFDPERVNK